MFLIECTFYVFWTSYELTFPRLTTKNYSNIFLSVDCCVYNTHELELAELCGTNVFFSVQNNQHLPTKTSISVASYENDDRENTQPVEQGMFVKVGLSAV